MGFSRLFKAFLITGMVWSCSYAMDSQERLNKSFLLAVEDAVENDDNQYVLDLLGKGANINYCDDYGMNALRLASEHGNTSLARKLIEEKININAQSDLGITALDSVCSAYPYFPYFVELLLKNGADVSIQDKRGSTAFDTAVDSYIQCLNKLLMDVEHIAISHDCEAMAKCLKIIKLLMDAENKNEYITEKVKALVTVLDMHPVINLGLEGYLEDIIQQLKLKQCSSEFKKIICTTLKDYMSIEQWISKYTRDVDPNDKNAMKNMDAIRAKEQYRLGQCEYIRMLAGENVIESHIDREVGNKKWTIQNIKEITQKRIAETAAEKDAAENNNN